MPTQNAVLHKKRKLLYAQQTTLGVIAVPDANTYILPAEEMEFQLNRGTLNINRSGLNFGGPGSVVHKRGSAGWTVTFSAELHDIADQNGVNPSLEPLVCCGLRAAQRTVSGETFVSYTVARDCALQGTSGTLPMGPSAGSLWLVEDCGTTYATQDATGTASFEFQTGERALVSYQMVARAREGVGVDLADCVFETTNTELAYGSAEDWTLPYVVVGATLKIDGEDPVNLQSLSIDLGMDISDAAEPRAVGGIGITKPELQEYITVSFNAAQDANNREVFWNKFFNDGSIDLLIELAGPEGGRIEIEMKNLRHDPQTVAEVNNRRHFDMTAYGFIRPEELDDLDVAYRNMFELRYFAPTASS